MAAPRILMIGNSFSQDALALAPTVAASAGFEFGAFNLYNGGCPLSRHLAFLNAGEAGYTYENYRANLPTVYRSNKVTLDEILAEGPWDIVTYQQASPLSGVAESYDDLAPLRAHVRKVLGDGIREVWHMTWAYAKCYEGTAFATYGNSQERMFAAIREAVDTKIRPLGLEVIPCGVAVQAARAGLPDEYLTRDNFHLSMAHGRYTAAMTLVGTLFGVDPEAVTYVPEGVTPEEAAVCRAAATLAIRSEK